jgi:hypothetical protein
MIVEEEMREMES